MLRHCGGLEEFWKHQSCFGKRKDQVLLQWEKQASFIFTSFYTHTHKKRKKKKSLCFVSVLHCLFGELFLSRAAIKHSVFKGHSEWPRPIFSSERCTCMGFVGVCALQPLIMEWINEPLSFRTEFSSQLQFSKLNIHYKRRAPIVTLCFSRDVVRAMHCFSVFCHGRGLWMKNVHRTVKTFNFQREGSRNDSVPRSTKFTTNGKTSIRDLLADEIEKYLWNRFLYRCCWNMKEEQFYDDFLTCFTFLPPMCSSCDPESVCRPVDVRFKLLFINFSFDEAFNKKIDKITPVFLFVLFAHLLLFCNTSPARCHIHCKNKNQ